MTDDRCSEYLEDPEAHPAHVETCADCRALQIGLNAPAVVRESAIDVDQLPLAPWEGASHRPWPLIAGAVLAVLAIALGVCMWAGLSPLLLAESPLHSVKVARATIDGAAGAIRDASRAWQIAFAILFLAVNGALVLLLRRAPRGVDA